LGDTASLTAWTLYNRQKTNFGTCYVAARAYSLEQQNARWAHAGLCRASSSSGFAATNKLCIWTSEQDCLYSVLRTGDIYEQQPRYFVDAVGYSVSVHKITSR